MSVSSCNEKQIIGHVALIPSAGMGHLTPFLRLASSLLISSHHNNNNNLKLTIITQIPTLTLSESQTLIQFSNLFPQITQIPLHLLPSSTNSQSIRDPFYDHMERINNSSHLLRSLLPSLSPPLSALITDMTLASSLLPITQSLNLPNYVFFTSSAHMLTLNLFMNNKIPRSWIPPPLLETTDNSLKTYFAENGKKMCESTGILVNTFQSIEVSSLRTLNGGGGGRGLPPVMAIGPLAPLIIDENNKKNEEEEELIWLGREPARSVVYVSFGNRTAMTRDQLRELGKGLLESGSKFLWIVKGKPVDTEDEGSLNEMIGSELMEKLKKNGMVLKKWVNQEEILKQESIGCFISHCGWNSVTEAIWNGVRVLAWPQLGDQKINANIVENIGLGIWPQSWGWPGEKTVNGPEIAQRIKDLMGNEVLRVGALSIREEAMKAVQFGGTSHKELRDLIKTWQQTNHVLI